MNERLRPHPGVERWNTLSLGRRVRVSYDVARTVVHTFNRLVWRVGVIGGEHIPVTGAFVLAPVHRSYIDTPLVASVTDRRLRYLGKEGMWRFRPVGWLLSALGGFPVNRGTTDRDALRRCEEVLALGQPLVMFPEGTRRSGPDIVDLFDGPAFVASRARVPIVPVGIGGSARAMPPGARMIRPTKIVLVVGEPIPPPPLGPKDRVPRQAVRDLTTRLGADLTDLYTEAERLALGG